MRFLEMLRAGLGKSFFSSFFAFFSSSFFSSGFSRELSVLTRFFLACRHTLIPPRGYSIAGVYGSVGPWLDGFGLIITR